MRKTTEFPFRGFSLFPCLLGTISGKYVMEKVCDKCWANVDTYVFTFRVSEFSLLQSNVFTDTPATQHMGELLLLVLGPAFIPRGCCCLGLLSQPW